MMRTSAGLGLFAVLSACRATPESTHAPYEVADELGQAKCEVRRSADKPLVVEWPVADRAALEARASQGLVAVRYVGCEMEVLSRCSAPGQYQYLGLTAKRETLRIRDADELYAQLPVGAAALEGKLKRSGQLNVDLSVVGRREAEAPDVATSELEGDCEGATHFVSGLTVGAFSLYTGQAIGVEGSVTVAGAGAGAGRSAERETLRQDGDSAACQQARAGDEAPPDQCSALLRVEVVPLAAVRRAEPAIYGAPASSEPRPSADPAATMPTPAWGAMLEPTVLTDLQDPKQFAAIQAALLDPERLAELRAMMNDPEQQAALRALLDDPRRSAALRAMLDDPRMPDDLRAEFDDPGDGPQDPPLSPPSLCDAVDFEIVKVRRRRADPPFHDRAMDEVRLRVRNGNGVPVVVKDGDQASLLDQERNVLAAEHSDWFMAQTLPPRSSKELKVLLEARAGARLHTVEVQVRPTDDITRWCTVVDDALRPAGG